MAMRILLLAPLALVACATTADSRAESDAELAKALAGRVAGAPKQCLDDIQLGSPQFIGDRTLVYRQSERRYWVNTLAYACSGMRSDSTPVFKLFGSQVCRGDTFDMVDRSSGIRGPTCRLGDFVPYEKPGN